jgi:hypothetical protein
MLLAKAMVTSGLLLALFAGCGSNMSAESSADSGVVDAGNTAGTADAGADAGIPDSGTPDAGGVDPSSDAGY